MGIYSTKPKWQQFLRPVIAFSRRIGLSPDFYSYGGIGWAWLAAIALLLAGKNLLWLWLVPLCVLLRLGFNLLDGMLARELGVADALGELKNEFGDRLSDLAIYLGIGLGGYASIQLAFITAAAVFLVSYLGILGKVITGKRIYTGVFGKGDRMLSLAVFCLYPLLSANLRSFDVYLGFSILAAGITIVQRIKEIHGATKSVS